MLIICCFVIIGCVGVIFLLYGFLICIGYDCIILSGMMFLLWFSLYIVLIIVNLLDLIVFIVLFKFGGIIILCIIDFDL